MNVVNDRYRAREMFHRPIPQGSCYDRSCQVECSLNVVKTNESIRFGRFAPPSLAQMRLSKESPKAANDALAALALALAFLGS